MLWLERASRTPLLSVNGQRKQGQGRAAWVREVRLSPGFILCLQTLATTRLTAASPGKPCPEPSAVEMFFLLLRGCKELAAVPLRSGLLSFLEYYVV